MTTAAEQQQIQQQGLYDPANEHDACGVGFVAHIKGEKRHDIVTQALKILENIDHRGAVGADPLMGDGAGILIQLPDALYREEMAKQGVTLPPAGEYGVGMIFLPKEHASRLACEQEMERAIKAEGQVLLGWRDVPVNKDMPMSPTVREKEPIMRQVFIGRGAGPGSGLALAARVGSEAIIPPTFVAACPHGPSAPSYRSRSGAPRHPAGQQPAAHRAQRCRPAVSAGPDR